MLENPLGVYVDATGWHDRTDEVLSVPVPQTYAKALDAIRNKAFIESLKYEEQQWRADRVGAHPKIIEFEEAIIRRFKKLDVPLFAQCVVRSPSEQAAAYALGNSTLSGVAPYPHQFAAVDIIHGVMAWNMPEKAWDLIGHIGMEIAEKLSIPITWGGDWDGDGDKTDQKLYDPAHFELSFWKSIQPRPPFMWMGGGSVDPAKLEGRIKPFGRSR